MESHPSVPEFTQCVTFHFFETESGERGYVIFGILAMYILPLLIIFIVNTIILWNIKKTALLKTPVLKKSFTAAFLSDLDSDHDSLRGNVEDTSAMESSGIALSIVRFQQSNRGSQLRLSTGLILYHSSRAKRQRTRIHTMKLSLLIVTGFILCYTPYAVVSVWSLLTPPQLMFDQLNDSMVEGLLLFTMSFSTLVNPLLYGSFRIYARNRDRRAKSKSRAYDPSFS